MLHLLKFIDHNDLDVFTLNGPLLHLETLEIAENGLESLDVGLLPRLHYLNIDANAINDITGVQDLKFLRHLSWREQRCKAPLQYQSCHEAPDLYLSGNSLHSFVPTISFFNMQILELASTGLQELPADFGIKFPNLRVLNMNYNAIRDISSLIGIAKLQRLYLAGNRVSRLRRTLAVLERLSSGLLEVDLRNNPLTVGFYTPSPPKNTEKRMVVQEKHRNGTIHDHETDSGEIRYLLPASDREADSSSRDRLDEETKLRRRVYEMLAVNACKKLQLLDGLEVERSQVGRRDSVWERLVDLGVLRHNR